MNEAQAAVAAIVEAYNMGKTDALREQEQRGPVVKIRTNTPKRWASLGLEQAMCAVDDPEVSNGITAEDLACIYFAGSIDVGCAVCRASENDKPCAWLMLRELADVLQEA